MKEFDALPYVAVVLLLAGFIAVIGIVILTSFQSNVNVGYTYVTSSDGSDFFGVNTATTNTSAFGVDANFVELTAFTPRLNFTVVVNDTFSGLLTGVAYNLKWRTPLNVSHNASFVVKNGSATVAASNYTLVRSGDVWVLNFTDSRYANDSLSYSFNRTFVKNVDDLYVNASGIYTGASASNFLTVSGGDGYGDDLFFLLNGASLGSYVNNQNWAVTWNVTTRTAANDAAAKSIDSSVTALSEINNNWLLIIAICIAAGIVIALVFQSFKDVERS